jgi:hypothetical protein
MKNQSTIKRKLVKENIVGKSNDKNKGTKLDKSKTTSINKMNTKVVKEKMKVVHKVNSPGDWYNYRSLLIIY